MFYIRLTLFSLPQTNVKTPSLLVGDSGKGEWGWYLFGRLMSNYNKFEDQELNLKTHGGPR